MEWNDRKFAQEEEGHEPLPDWAYLIHHVQSNPDGEEELHHCSVLDHLGNLYKVDHIETKEGDVAHCIVGLEEDQDVYWSDEDAEIDGNTVPCANRQLPSA
jgi:hypothetical protein